MGTAKPRTPAPFNRAIAGAIALTVLAVTFLFIGALSGRHKDKSASAADDVAEGGDRAAESTRALAAAPLSRPAPRAADDGASRRAEEQRKASVLLDGVRFRMLNLVPNPEEVGLEAVGNMMEPYVQGTLSTLRSVNPALIGALRDSLVERTCAHPQSDVELMLAARMLLTDSNLGAPRIFDCGLRGRKKEDIVLWTMLDAWRAAGRPSTEVVADIKAFAIDERTIRRLTADSPQELERLAAVERARAAADTQEAQAQNANRKEIAQ
jgi:hypothetical protein